MELGEAALLLAESVGSVVRGLVKRLHVHLESVHESAVEVVERELSLPLALVLVAEVLRDVLVVALERLERVVGDALVSSSAVVPSRVLPHLMWASRKESGLPGSSASIQRLTLQSSTAIGLTSTP